MGGEKGRVREEQVWVGGEGRVFNTCQHLEIRNHETLLIALTPSPNSKPNVLAAYSENFFINQFAEKRLVYVLNTSALKTGISTC